MRHTKIAAVVLTAALLLALAVGLAACGSSESDGDGDATPSAEAATTTYHNDEYGFSITYPSDYKEAPVEFSSSTANGPVFDIGFGDPEGTIIDDMALDGLQISVYELSKKVPPESVPDLEKDFQNLVDSLMPGLEDGKILDPLGPVELNGVPGFGFSYTYKQGDTEIRATTFFLVKGQYQYVVTAQASMDRWDEVSPELEAAAMSFMVD